MDIGAIHRPSAPPVPLVQPRATRDELQATVAAAAAGEMIKAVTTAMAQRLDITL